MLGVVVLQSGLVLFAVGFILAALRAATLAAPRHGLALAAAGVGLVLLGALLPARRRTAPRRLSMLDDCVPDWEFHERHSRRIAAPPDRVYAAIQSLPAGDIRFFGILTWLRRFGRPLPAGILNAPKRQPILDTAVAGGFLRLAEDPPREIVVGAVVIGQHRLDSPLDAARFTRLAAPGFAKAAMNFAIAPDGPGRSLVTTETRIHATDPRSARRFAMYWRIIQPGSGFIRRMWLRAIQVRAEGESES